MSSIEIFKQQRIEKEDELKSRIAQQAARINDLLKEQQKKMRIVEDPATTTPLVEVAAAPNSQINAQRISQLEYDLTEVRL